MLSAFFGSVGLWPHHVVTPDMEARADAALDIMEVGHLADRFVNQLSSGEARRLLVARALAHGPQALVLDEPTNSLDLRACRDFVARLRALAQQGTNIILVTHHLPDIVPEIDRVVVLKDGRVFRDGPKADVLSSDVLSESLRRARSSRIARWLLRRLVSADAVRQCGLRCSVPGRLSTCTRHPEPGTRNPRPSPHRPSCRRQ